MKSCWHSNSAQMQLNDLKPLEKLGLKLPSSSKIDTARAYIQRKRDKLKDEKSFNILTELYEMRAAFPEVYNLYAAIDTFACSTAVCENSFSALSQINIPSRLSMNNERMRHLAFLAFEHKRLKTISIENVMQEFNDKKNRKMQLYLIK